MSSEYEQQRVRNIERNEKYLETLGLHHERGAHSSSGAKRRKNAMDHGVRAEEDGGERRRSARIASIETLPTYKEEPLGQVKKVSNYDTLA
jgi:hypothetical protein